MRFNRTALYPLKEITMKNRFYSLILFVLILLLTATCQTKKTELQKMHVFGEEYTAAWNSQVPAQMASFYAEDGSLAINNGKPATGRNELEAVARSFMEAFPDLTLTMDSLLVDSNTYRYHWTFNGTNTGPGGTGNTVVFSGFERWTMNDKGLIQKSIGTFDADDYNRQLNAKR